MLFVTIINAVFPVGGYTAIIAIQRLYAFEEKFDEVE